MTSRATEDRKVEAVLSPGYQGTERTWSLSHWPTRATEKRWSDSSSDTRYGCTTWLSGWSGGRRMRRT